ncbi:MAG TPA: transcriptional regulator, partial [Streptosporangiaceae bacterium]|nr:transcriptional regulator [Streptosporangiaceae bacterium]
WPCLFPQHGPGKKHNRKIELAPWQQQIVDLHPEQLIRGLIHSDGCRLTNRVRRQLPSGDRWYEYPRYLFVNQSTDILRLYGEALDRLGIAWRYSKPNTISVAKREAVARLDEFVGPKY